MNNVRAIQKINEAELESGSKKSWHDMYSHSAYVFIGGLDYGLTEGDILAVFSQYGEIININLVKDRKTGKSKGFCFLCYDDQRSTILAVDNFNGIKLCGRTLRVDHVKEYRRPKDESGNEIIEKGCAPKTPTPSPTPSPPPSPESMEEPKKKAKKAKDKKKKKLKAKKKLKGSDPDSEIDSSGNDMDMVRNPGAKKLSKNGKEKTKHIKEEHEQGENQRERFDGRSGGHNMSPSPPPRQNSVKSASRNDRGREPLSGHRGSRRSYRDERQERSRSRSTSREGRRRRYRDERTHFRTGKSRSRSRERSEHYGKHSDRSKHTHR